MFNIVPRDRYRWAAVTLIIVLWLGFGLAGDPEEHLDAMGIIRYHGYPAEAYWATTEDGYILGMQRIPHGRNDSSGQNRPVVFLQHGLLCSSTNWITNLPNESFAFLLADAGYDVWLGNVRGNTYSRNHTTLNPDKDKAFWQFTWDEMGRYDLSAMIDKALAVSGQSEVVYVGHSQGTMIAFAGFSTNQTLAKKVKAYFALAPVSTLGHIEGALRVLSYLYAEIADLFKVFGEDEFLPSTAFLRYLARNLCGVFIIEEACGDLLFLIAGYNRAGLNETRLPVYLTHTPAGTSVRNMVHFGQMVRSNLFQMYNFGSEKENNIHYGQPTPPLYPLEEITVPITMFTGGQDWLADPIDVASLRLRLRTLKQNVTINTFEHLDFVWGMQAPEYIYKPIINMLKNL